MQNKELSILLWSKKKLLMVISSVLFAIVLSIMLIFNFVKSEVLVNEIMELKQITSVFTSVITQRFLESEPKLKMLAQRIEMDFSKPIQQNDMTVFHQQMERDSNGIWQNKQSNFNPEHEARVFLPSTSTQSDLEKIQFLRIKQTLDVAGDFDSARVKNTWYVSPNHSAILFDKSHSNAILPKKIENDYIQILQLKYATALNPDKKIHFSPPFFDSELKSWMVSTIYPLYVNNEWMGVLGQDIPIMDVFKFMIQFDPIYFGTEHFLMDNKNNFIFKNEETTFQTLMKEEPAFFDLLLTPLSSKPELLTNNLSFNNQPHIVIGMTIAPLKWRYYVLVPVNQIMTSTHELFSKILNALLFFTGLNGLIAFLITNSAISNRINTLKHLSDALQNFHRITDELEQEKIKLQESRDQFKALISNIPGVTFRYCLDANWTTLFMSGLVYELTGYVTEDFMNNKTRTYVSVIHPDDEQRVFDEINKAIHKNLPYTVEYRILHKNGDIRWVDERGSGVKNEHGEVLFVDGFVVDITERYEMELNLKKHRQKLALINADLLQFTHVAAHHLQEPTRRVVSFIQKLKSELGESSTNESVKLLIQFIEQSALRQRALVRDIQIYLAANKPRAKIKETDMTEVLSHVLRKHAPLIHDLNANVICGELPFVLIDHPRLFDVFDILLHNALIFHIVDRNLKIRIYGERHKTLVRYYIEDNGMGIPVQYRERVFLVFERLQTSINQESTGIGLSTVRNIMESLNGAINLEESLGGGLTVVLDFPNEIVS